MLIIHFHWPIITVRFLNGAVYLDIIFRKLSVWVCNKLQACTWSDSLFGCSRVMWLDWTWIRWSINSLRERWRLIDDQTPTRCKWLFSLHLSVSVCVWMSFSTSTFCTQALNVSQSKSLHTWRILCVCVCVSLQYFHRGRTRDFKDLQRSHSVPSLSYWPQGDRRTETHMLCTIKIKAGIPYAHT